MKKILLILFLTKIACAEIAFDRLSLGVVNVNDPNIDYGNWYFNISTPSFPTAAYLSLRVKAFDMASRMGTASFGYEFYPISTGTFLDSHYIESASVFYSNRPGRISSGPIAFNDSQVFYVGFWLDADLSQNESVGDYYGWAKLSSSSGTLNLLEQATEINRNGIVVGAIPEPSTYLMMGLGLAVVAFGWRRRSSGAKRNQRRVPLDAGS